MLFILFLVVGFLLGFFVSSVYFQFIIDEVVEHFIYGELEDETKKDKK